MKTELLNEFIFADLINKHAELIRNERIKSDPDDIPRVTEDDLREAFENLQILRANTRVLIHNSEDMDAPTNILDFPYKP